MWRPYKEEAACSDAQLSDDIFSTSYPLGHKVFIRLPEARSQQL